LSGKSWRALCCQAVLLCCRSIGIGAGVPSLVFPPTDRAASSWRAPSSRTASGPYSRASDFTPLVDLSSEPVTTACFATLRHVGPSTHLNPSIIDRTRRCTKHRSVDAQTVLPFFVVTTRPSGAVISTRRCRAAPSICAAILAPCPMTRRRLPHSVALEPVITAFLRCRLGPLRGFQSEAD
jgi:hypothetical protein